MALFDVNIVSLHEEIFSGKAKFIALTGTEGDLGIAPMHAPLLTKIMPGPVRITTDQDEIFIMYVRGGFLEVQPTVVTILANMVLQSDALVEEEAIKAKERAEQQIQKSLTGDFDYSLARVDLLRALGVLRTLKEIRDKVEHVR